MKAAQLELPMTLSRVLAEPTSDAMASKLEIVAQSHGGVGALRRLILGLALHGRLLQALDGDGHAGRLLRGTTPKASDPSVGRPPEEALPTLPPHWVWAPVGEIADCVLGKMLDKSKHTSGTKRPYLRNLNVRWGSFDLSDLLEMYFEDSELERYAAKPGDVLVCEGGEPGRAAVWTEQRPVLIQKAIHRIRLGEGILPHWLVMNLRYDTWTGRLERYFTGATIKHFTGRALEAYSIRLPPTLEQKRIVTKVDQLMALCDELEAKQTRKRDAGDRLTKAALGALTSAESPEELQVAWPRVAGDFDELIDRPEKVQALRTSIIELAMRGTLTAQREGDEAVDQLLGRIRAEQKATGAAKAQARDELQSVPFPIPQSWRWVRWGDLTLATSSGWSPQCESRPREGDGWGVLKVSAVSWFLFKPEENKALPVGVAPRPEFAVRDGDFLMSRANTSDLVGRSVVVEEAPEHLILSDKIIRCVFSRWIDRRFVNLYNRTATARVHYVAHASGTSDSMKNISRDVILSMPIPLPPLAEQQHIVARVEQLMKLCDDLEAKLRARDEKAARLAAALVAEAIA